jgi:hypothetical protein
MKLVNFSLDCNVGAIELNGLSHCWDLHNFSLLEMINYNLFTNILIITFSAPKIINPWGDETNNFKKCLMFFSGVKKLNVVGLLDSKNITNISLQDISFIKHGEVDPNYRKVDKIENEQDLGFLISFYGGIKIEIFAQTVEIKGE